jgi:hypothetical protein
MSQATGEARARRCSKGQRDFTDRPWWAERDAIAQRFGQPVDPTHLVRA